MNIISNSIIKWNFIKKIHKSALHAAVEEGKVDIVKILLTNKKIDLNIRNI